MRTNVIAKYWKLKKDAPRGECAFAGCKKKPESTRNKWCPKHREEARSIQTKEGNKKQTAKRKSGPKTTKVKAKAKRHLRVAA